MTLINLKVTGVMRSNIGAVLDRGNNLSDLQDRFKFGCEIQQRRFLGQSG